VYARRSREHFRLSDDLDRRLVYQTRDASINTKATPVSALEATI
jgi:hypothetical protein